MPKVMAALRSPLFNAAKFGQRPLLNCRAVTLQDAKPLKLAEVQQTPEPISAASVPKFTVL